MKKIIISIFILLPALSFAQVTEYQLLEPLPCIEGVGQTCNSSGLIEKINTNAYVVYVFKFSIAFAAVAAVMVIIISGFQYATSDIISTKGNAKERINNALMGLVTILASYLILQTIDPRLVELTDFGETLKPLDIKGYDFNYNEALETAANYQIEQNMESAKKEMSVMRKSATELEKKAAELRAKEATSAEDHWNNEIEAQKLEQQAKDLKSQANLVGHEFALDADYLKAKAVIDSVTKGTLTDSQKEEIERKKRDLINASNENIEKMKKANDIEGAQDLQKRQAYSVAKIDQDVVLKTSVEAVRNIKENYANIDRAPNAMAIKAANAAEVKKIIENIQKYTPSVTTLSLKENEELALERRTALEQIEKINNPQQ